MLAPVPEGYKPAEYWSERLSGEYNLRGTGHLAYSASYNDWIYRVKRRALRRGLKGVPSGASALDLGSGTGWVVEEMLGRGLKVDGCDIADVAVQRLGERFPAANFFQIALGSAPLPRKDASFDVVTMFDVAYHMTDDELWTETLREVGRVLRPGGRFVVSDRLGAEDVAAAEHVRFRSLARWDAAAAEAGLERTALKPYYRWISRERGASRLARLPDGARGAVEFALETIAPREPHVRLGVFERRDGSR
jgi:SAM-dependent methyltransferase